MEKTSYIRGMAEVVFGGSIRITGATMNGKQVLAFTEMEQQLECGTEIPQAEFDKPPRPQVVLAFDNIKSVNVLRDALDMVEKYLNHDKPKNE